MAVWLFAIELCLVVVTLAAAYMLPGWGTQGFQLVSRALKRLAVRPRLAIVVVAFAAMGGRLALLPFEPIPYPVIHDEFSHLLVADTLSQGRLANPPHPLWQRFESVHIIQQPTYASMYYPGQGFVLAVGQVVFGDPFWGVLLSVGVMCGAICWMLQGWLPGKWALVGAFLSVARLGLFSYWANSYLGGPLTAIGGALVLGVLPRIRRKPGARLAITMAVGLALIVMTRPFEGLFFALPAGIALAIWMFGKRGPSFSESVRRVVLPASLVLTLAIAALGYYCWSVTGSPVRIPYQVAMETYGLLYFPWQEPTAPASVHAALQSFYVESLAQYHEAIAHPYMKAALSLALPWVFFMAPLMTLPLVAWAVFVPRTSRFPTARGRNVRNRWKLLLRPLDSVAGFQQWNFCHGLLGRKMRFWLLVCLISSVALLLPVYIPQPHYAAACAPAIYAITAQAMRRARRWKVNGKPAGMSLVFSVPLIAVALLLLRAAGPAMGFSLHPENPRLVFFRTWSSPQPDMPERSRMDATLKSLPGRQLAIVRYRPDHDTVFHEWVYNEANIDQAKVVWAREMTPAENDALITYFKDRQIWLVEPDEAPPRLSPYR